MFRAASSWKASMGIGAGSAAGEDEDVEISDRDASGEELDQDAEGEDDNDYLLHQQITTHGPNDDDHGDIEEEGDVDAEGEEYDHGDIEEEGDVDAEGEEYDQDEGVGAVKFKPGETDDEEDLESNASDPPSVLEDESDEEAPWEDARDVGEEDEESEAIPSNNCIFCKQDEENDPSEDFEVFLGCAGCGDNAHQQCARDSAAMSEQNNPKNWKCPDCFHGDSDIEEQDDQDMEDQGVDDDDRFISQQSDAPELPGELLPSQSRIDGSSSPSALTEDPLMDDDMDESHTLRKRKSSSLESEDNAVSLRKRRRNQSNEPNSSNEDALDNENSTEATRQHPSRARLKVTRPPPVTIEKRTRNALILKIQVRPGNLKEILSRRKRDRRRPPAGSAVKPPPPRPATSVVTPTAAATPKNDPPPISILPTPFTSDTYSQPFYSFFDRETEDMKGKPYGGILSEAEADTSKTLPIPEDRRKFDEAKQKAEDEWRARVLALQAEADVPIRKSKKATENASQIECIEFGGWEIDTWYAAPYPAEYSRNRVLYICEFCLKYMNSDYVAWRHKLKCPAKHPPGDEIYRYGSVSVFEVDGRKNPVYCQNLCLLAKLFLGSKTLYYDVEPFLFYVLCEYDDCGYHFRKGYGNLLIDFSYLLTKVEEKTGSPEKPLSDMGLVSYRNYWRLILCRYFLSVMDGKEYKKQGLSIKQISDNTGMTADDVIAALEGLRALVRDPQTKLYAFRVDVDYCRQYVAKWESKGHVRLKPEALAWTPYVMGRSNAANFELGPPINTIAPREDDEAKVDEGLDNIVTESQPTTNGENKSVSEQGTELPLESTEAEDEAVPEPVNSIERMAPDDDEGTSIKDEEMHDVEEDSGEPWELPYRGIPPARFEIFPTITGSRRSDRSRQSGSRPSAPRTGSSSSRPKRPGGSSSHRPSSSRPNSSRSSKSSSRRKSGGTGRGPGRWPKGTKKADYGNADSGPGLPPGWKEKDPPPLLQPITEGQDPEKCDGGRPSCQRCLTRNELCVGYRDEADLIFQHETDKVALKSQAESISSSSSTRTRRTRSRSLERPSAAQPLDTSNLKLPSAMPWLKTPPSERDPPAVEDRAVAIFMDKYVIYPCHESSSPGFLEHLPCLFSEVNVDGRHALRWAVQAAGIAELSREQNSELLAPRALECYGQALSALGKSLAEKGKTPDDYDLMAVVILDMFESLFMPDAPVGSHTQGMAHILRLRGHEQFHDPRGWSLFRLAHHRLQKHQLAKQIAPLPESEVWLDSLNEEVSTVRLEKDALEISTMCQKANEILRSLSAETLSLEQFLDLFPQMTRLDQKAALQRCKPEWHFKTLQRSEVVGNQDVISRFPEKIELHRDVWMAYEWNYHRTARIILHQKLLACLERARSLSTSQHDFDSEIIIRYEEETSLSQIEILADEILATVPQSFGEIDRLGRCLPDPSKPPRCQAIGAYLLLWPMKIIKDPKGMAKSSQKAAAQVLFERIRECTGMKSNLGALSII
ncbi:hypothetical protein G7Z17_g11413 [Cylindrodendrum hubeiense]|uniref:Histone acetyltransferase n=1 Tax=Cylindrodendrum hubeiense TaxID=595255 RepID=A0A9P5H092_9HYPO|nr:hypothetical protein G7Z17_g11413 [Cylindrodendrum hubeiense]